MITRRNAAIVCVGAIIFCAIAVIGVINLSALRDSRLALLDSVLDNWAIHEAGRVIRTEPERTFADLPPELGSANSVEILVLVMDADGSVLSRSRDWPKDIDSSSWVSKAPTVAGLSQKAPSTSAVVTSSGIVRRGDVATPGVDMVQRPTSAAPDADSKPILFDGERDVTLRHFATRAAGGMIRWVAARAGPFTVFAGVRAGVVGGSLAWLVYTFGAVAVIGTGMGTLLTHRVLVIYSREQVALADWTRRAADGSLAAPEPPAVSPDLEDLRGQLARLQRRLATSLEQAYRFTGDAAHELRSPLTAIQVKIDRLINRSVAASDLQRDLADVADDIHQLSTLVRRLFWLALADAGRLQVHRVTVDLSLMLRDVTEDLVAGAIGLTLTLHIDPGLQIEADTTLLEHAIANLISNAVKHNRPGGWIDIKTMADAKSVIVSVSNSVAHPLPISRERVFERFFRGGYARALTDGSSGIGLSLAREIARAHGGDILVEDSSRDEARFTLRLPMALPFGVGSVPLAPTSMTEPSG
jgi:two-component system, OmpR family, heavy metal sensor histidine kinase CusS